MEEEINLGRELVKRRWDKQKPDRKFLKKISKLGIEARWGKDRKKDGRKKQKNRPKLIENETEEEKK